MMKKKGITWDNLIPTDKMFKYCYELLKLNHVCLLFSNGTYSYELYNHQNTNFRYLYKYIWLKNEWGNHLLANKAPLNKTEEIMVFKKVFDCESNSELRLYAEYIFRGIGLSRKKIREKMGNWKSDHFFRYNGLQFNIPSYEGYQELIELFHIDSFEKFKTYDELLELKNDSYSIFNLENGFKTNVLEYDKVKYQSLHPTQKPVDLLEDLILTYSNEGDTVLDFTMGSGSTGIACMNTNRNFIGIELDEKYYNIAKERIEKYIDDNLLNCIEMDSDGKVKVLK